jgi:hypothetical protein
MDGALATPSYPGGSVSSFFLVGMRQRLISLSDDMAILEGGGCTTARLVIVDPFMSFLNSGINAVSCSVTPTVSELTTLALAPKRRMKWCPKC